MFNKLIHLISAERSSLHNSILSPTISQHKTVYSFCRKFTKNKNIVEIGCGTGFGANFLAMESKSVVAIDSDKFAIEECQQYFQRNNLTFISSSIESFTSIQKVDTVICLQVIEHLNTPEILLKKTVDLLKKNGHFIISTPNAATQSYNENPYHIKEFTASELKNLLEKYFEEVTIYGLFGDGVIENIEKKRREQILKIFAIDIFNFRKKTPLVLRQRLFDIATLLNRSLISLRTKQSSTFSEKNFTIKRLTNNAIDLLAVCSNHR